MSHSTIKNIWKFSWNPQGHGVQIVEVSTKKKVKGSIINLDHTFFRGKEFTAELSDSGSSLDIGYEDKPLTGKEDLILRLYDPKLSQLSNSGVYRAVELNSSRVCNTTLKISVNFVADAISPEDFGQSLSPESDVEHKSIKVESLTSESAIIQNLKVSSDLSGKWGSFNDKGLSVKGSLLETKEDSLENGTLKTTQPLKIECGKGEKGKIRYNPETFLWETWNPRAQAFVPFVVSSAPTDKIPIGCVPYVSGSDLAATSFLESFQLDPLTKTLKVPQIETEDIQSDEESVHISTKKRVYINGHKFQDLNGILSIDDVLQIDPKNQSVSINGVTIDKDLFATIKQLAKKIDALEKEIRG